MRVLVITDTHGIYRGVYEKNKDKLVDLDRVILLGDHYVAEVNQMKEHFKNILMYGLYGNHDMPDTLQNIPNFDHKLMELGNFHYTGLNGSHRYKPTQAFGYEQPEGIIVCKSLPKADVLFCHDGPYNPNKDDAHCGLKGISQYIKDNKPKTVIHGHLHSPNHYTIKNSLFGGKTDVYCVYQLAIVDFNDDGTVNKVDQLETFL